MLKTRQRTARKKTIGDYIRAKISNHARGVVVGKNMIFIGRVVVSIPPLLALVLGMYVLIEHPRLFMPLIHSLNKTWSEQLPAYCSAINQFDDLLLAITIKTTYLIGRCYEGLGCPDTADMFYRLALFLQVEYLDAAHDFAICILTP